MSTTAPLPEIEHRPAKVGGRGVYRIPHPPGKPARMVYSRPEPGLVVIDHTEVPEELTGMGVGGRLVARAVADAREGGWKIRPDCPFARSRFEQHPEWGEVLLPG